MLYYYILIRICYCNIIILGESGKRAGEANGASGASGASQGGRAWRVAVSQPCLACSQHHSFFSADQEPTASLPPPSQLKLADLIDVVKVVPMMALALVESSDWEGTERVCASTIFSSRAESVMRLGKKAPVSRTSR